jgi:hypothetical protein
VKKSGLFLAAILAAGVASAAQATEIYSFSGRASYQANGANTGGTYNISFQSPDAPQDGGAGYTYVYNLTGSATFTPDFPSLSIPIVTADLIGTFTLLLRQDATAPAYYVDLLNSSATILFSITGDASDVGQLDLTKPGSATPTTNIIDQAYIDFVGGGAAIIQVPTTYLTFSIADAPAAVPEPASWMLMIGGFGMAGAAMRRRPRTSVRFV